jgi:subtilisin family serine protease
MSRPLRRVVGVLAVTAVLAGLALVGAAPASSAASTTGAATAPDSSGSPAPVAPGLEAKAAAGDVRVIAVTEVAGERVADDVATAAPADSISDVSAGAAKQVVATVDAAGLDALREVPGVTQVVEDKVNRIADDTWPTVIGLPAPRTAGYDGTGRTVAVLDAGVQVDHPFLGGRVIGQACFSSGSVGVESLCPGQASEAHGDGSATACSGVPGCDHGTHVAGLAVGAQLTGPSTLTGTAPGASLIAVKVFSKGTSSAVCGGAPPCLVAFDSDLVDALTWLDGLRQAGDPLTETLDAVNMSLGGGLYNASCDTANPTVTAVFSSLRSHGVVPVVAAGNNGSRSSISSPACISAAVSVAATNGAGAVAGFSNISYFTTLLAPGTGMTSSITGSSYGVMSGTSMATPVVAGSIAVMRQANPFATIDTIVDRLRTTGTNVSTASFGLPEVQLDSATLLFPGDVRSLGAVSSFGAVTVSWQPPGYLGPLQAVTSYTVTASPGGASCTTAGLTCRISGLTNGASYSFRVVARDDLGNAGAGTAVSASPKALAGSVPFGSLDLAGPTPGAVVVAGWAIDPETSAPIAVHVYVDGVGTAVVADGSRPDVDAAYGYGAQHGFYAPVPVAGGTHAVCVYAINAVGTAGANAGLGCRYVTVPTGPPIGSLDVATSSPGKVVVGGWAIDPDTADPIAVHVYVDSIGAAFTAGQYRSDLAGFFGPYGGNHAFNGAIAAPPGVHTVCAYGINLGGGANSSLGCKVVTVPGGSPFGSFDLARRNAGGTLTVGGWAIDPDTADPITVSLLVAGPGFPLTAVPLASDAGRSDLASIFPVYGAPHGFSATVLSGLPAGSTVCAIGIDVGVGSDTVLGCKVVP